MKARARILGHPIHQTLVVFPLGLLATSFLFDVAWLLTDHADLARVAWLLIGAGVIGVVVAALFGMIDWIAIPKESGARRLGAWHGAGNALVAFLFASGWTLRRHPPHDPEGVTLALSASGFLLILLTGWLGGELAERMAEEEESGGRERPPLH